VLNVWAGRRTFSMRVIDMITAVMPRKKKGDITAGGEMERA
jgi:hypothetical protein